jgi:hypothetical protein
MSYSARYKANFNLVKHLEIHGQDSIRQAVSTAGLSPVGFRPPMMLKAHSFLSHVGQSAEMMANHQVMRSGRRWIFGAVCEPACSAAF